MFSVLKTKEKIILPLRSVYKKYGYSEYTVNKFEEYDLYAKNKDFLVSGRVITFTDTDGKLLALKPDVTLSIIKNCKNIEGTKKYFYDESVFRVSGGTGAFKEITQAGLECLGKVDDYQIYEVLFLALSSLSCFSKEFVLYLSDLDIVTAIMDKAKLSIEAKNKILNCLSSKSISGVKETCLENGICAEDEKLLVSLIKTNGNYEKVKDVLNSFVVDEKSKIAVERFNKILSLLSATEYGKNIVVDFSVVNDVNYYNGIVFNGFIEGVPTSVLSGGQYDNLMIKMGKNGCAIGFAVYANRLENLFIDKENEKIAYLIYGNDTPLEEIFCAFKKLSQKYNSVKAQTTRPEEDGAVVVDLTKGEKVC